MIVVLTEATAPAKHRHSVALNFSLVRHFRPHHEGVKITFDSGEEVVVRESFSEVLDKVVGVRR